MKEVIQNLKSKEEIPFRTLNLQVSEELDKAFNLKTPQATTLQDLNLEKFNPVTNNFQNDSTMNIYLKSRKLKHELEESRDINASNSLEPNQSIMENVLLNLEQSGTSQDLISSDNQVEKTPIQKKRLKFILTAKEGFYESSQDLSVNNSHRNSFIRNKK